MPDFYATSRAAPLDQADGLRRLFSGRQRRTLALVANPHVAFGGAVLDRLAAVLCSQGRQVLVVDASSTSPLPSEMAALDLAACIEPVFAGVGYLPACGLPMAYVDTRGSASAFIDAVQAAAPQADVVLLHADAQDLARIFKRRSVRPLLIGADHPESIKHAYAGAKLLARRAGLLSFDLLLAASPQSPRAAAIAQSLASCAETFLDAVLCHTALVDPAGDPAAPADAALASLLAAQWALDDGELLGTITPSAYLAASAAASAAATAAATATATRPAFPFR